MSARAEKIKELKTEYAELYAVWKEILKSGGTTSASISSGAGSKSYSRDPKLLKEHLAGLKREIKRLESGNELGVTHIGWRYR